MLTPDERSLLGLAPERVAASSNSSGVSQALRAIGRGEVEPAREGVTTDLRVCPIRHTWDLEEVYRITHDAYVAKEMVRDSA